MELKVNDKVWQKGNTGDMIFNFSEIISFASQFMTWEPGDVIASGTLDGTGDAAGVYLKAGDVQYGTIGNLGTLVTPVKGGPRRPGCPGGPGRRPAPSDEGGSNSVAGEPDRRIGSPLPLRAVGWPPEVVDTRSDRLDGAAAPHLPLAECPGRPIATVERAPMRPSAAFFHRAWNRWRYGRCAPAFTPSVHPLCHCQWNLAPHGPLDHALSVRLGPSGG